MTVLPACMLVPCNRVPNARVRGAAVSWPGSTRSPFAVLRPVLWKLASPVPLLLIRTMSTARGAVASRSGSDQASTLGLTAGPRTEASVANPTDGKRRQSMTKDSSRSWRLNSASSSPGSLLPTAADIRAAPAAIVTPAIASAMVTLGLRVQTSEASLAAPDPIRLQSPTPAEITTRTPPPRLRVHRNLTTHQEQPGRGRFRRVVVVLQQDRIPPPRRANRAV